MEDSFREVESALERGGFEYCWSDGCFDIAARRDFSLFLKILGNVDSFQESQANNLKVVARDFNAAVAVVGKHTRRETLQDNVVYERFDVPTFTPKTLETIVSGDDFPHISRARGGFFAEIDPARLRLGREKAGLSQSQLAERVGVSKKNIYEHEHAKMKAQLSVARKIESLIGDVTEPVVMNFEYEAKNNAKGFERQVSIDLEKIGLKTDIVYQTPFNIFAKHENIILLSKADDNPRRLSRSMNQVSEIANLMEIPALAVAKEEIDLDVPCIQEKDLRGMSRNELRRLLK